MNLLVALFYLIQRAIHVLEASYINIYAHTREREEILFSYAKSKYRSPFERNFYLFNTDTRYKRRGLLGLIFAVFNTAVLLAGI